MSGFDLTGYLFSHINSTLSSTRTLLLTVIAHRHTFEKYDKAYVKGLKKKGEVLKGVIIGPALMGGTMVMAFTKFFKVNGVMQGVLKVGVVWATAFLMSGVVHTIGLTKHNKPRLQALASKYNLPCS